MKRTIILLVLALPMLAILLLGCTTEVTPTPVPTSVNPAEIALTMLWQKGNAEATQMSVNIQFTATAQVVEATRNVESTQAAMAVTEQARQDVMATDQQGREDAAATEESRRRDAAATEQRIRDDAATQQARRDIEATAEQDRQNVVGTATAQMAAIWNAATLQVMPTHDFWTQQAVIVEQALATNEVELSNLDVKQQTQKNTAEWVVPLLVVLAIVAVFALVQIRRSRVNQVKNEETGDVEAVIVDNVKAFKPQLMSRPLMLLEVKEDEDGVDPKEQSDVTRRAQTVEALRAMPTQAPTANATGLMNSVFSQASKPPVIEAWTPSQVSRVILDELSDQVIEEE